MTFFRIVYEDAESGKTLSHYCLGYRKLGKFLYTIANAEHLDEFDTWVNDYNFVRVHKLLKTWGTFKKCLRGYAKG